MSTVRKHSPTIIVVYTSFDIVVIQNGKYTRLCPRYLRYYINVLWPSNVFWLSTCALYTKGKNVVHI